MSINYTAEHDGCVLQQLTDQSPPPINPLGHNGSPSLQPYVGRLWSEPCLVGQVGLGVRVSASFQKNSPPGSVI